MLGVSNPFHVRAGVKSLVEVVTVRAAADHRRDQRGTAEVAGSSPVVPAIHSK
jgi:hypothetical protein